MWRLRVFVAFYGLFSVAFLLIAFTSGFISFVLGSGFVIYLTVEFWRYVTALRSPPESLVELASRLDIPLKVSQRFAEDFSGDADPGVQLQRQVEGVFGRLRFTYADDTGGCRLSVFHPLPLGVGLYCHFNVPKLSRYRLHRPVLAREVRVNVPHVTCAAVRSEQAQRLFEVPAVREALTQFTHVVGRYETALFVLDDDAVVVVKGGLKVDEELLRSMCGLSAAIRKSGVVEIHRGRKSPKAVRVRVRVIFIFLMGILAGAVLLFTFLR